MNLTATGLAASSDDTESTKILIVDDVPQNLVAMADDRERCLEAGANDYIAKPIDVDKLVSLCRVWCSRQ